jgi:DNA-binding NtrC family response regulator
MKRVLLIDSGQASDDGARSRLEQDGYEVIECQSADQALERFRDGAEAVVLLELSDSVRLLHELRAVHPEIPVIVLSASSSEAIGALKEGADFVVKPPLSLEELSILTRRATGDSASGQRASSRPEGNTDSGKKSVDYQLPSQGIDFRELEREVLTQALRLASGNQTRAATLLGLTRDQVRYRMAKFGMTSRDTGRPGAEAA